MTNRQNALLELEDITVEFSSRRGRPPLRAVDHVSFEIFSRETVGLVGESGSGKSTIGRVILGLTPVQRGRVVFESVDITQASYRERQRLSSRLQVVFQDPYGSLNPARTIGQTLAETLRAQGAKDREYVQERVRWMLEKVGLPTESTVRYPAHFSGGQRQRIAIARALMAEPRLIVCDEPTSALDLSVQAQIINLLEELQAEFQMSYLFVSHDLAVVRRVSQRIVVLYGGTIMEQGPAQVIYERPLHPYTRMLLSAAPVPDPELQQARRMQRRVRLMAARDAEQSNSEGCRFAARCEHAIDVCHATRPELEVAEPGVLVACHRWRELVDVEPTTDPSKTDHEWRTGRGMA